MVLSLNYIYIDIEGEYICKENEEGRITELIKIYVGGSLP